MSRAEGNPIAGERQTAENAEIPELLRLERRLEAVLAQLAEAVTVVDENGRTVFANQAAADLLGVATPGELMSAAPGSIMPRFQVLDEHGRELDLESMPGRRLFAGENPQPLLVRNIVRATGEERWLVVRSSPVLDPDTDRIAYAVNVFENITEVKRAQLNERFMSEASRVLASSMDYNETLQQVARLAVPRLADWCAVDVLNERGEIELVAVHHADPDKLAMAERLDRRYRPALDDATGVAEVLRTGEARIFTDIQTDALIAYAHDEEHMELLRMVGPQAVIIVPMIGATGTIGTITLVSSESPRRLSAVDLALAERLARRSGTSVERARIYTERSRIAHILERSLLPESLPEIPGAQIQARYSPAGEINEVGGDFYDLFQPRDGQWILVIGDVCGKGPRAAGVTALARHTLRAAALSEQAPAEMLRTLHRALRLQPAGADLCTACVVLMEPTPECTRLTVALAGHQPPLRIEPEGAVTALGEPGTLLGVLDPIDIIESTGELRAGETLLLYTDGVTEAGRAGRQLGESGLRGLCAQTAHLPLDGVLEHIEHAVLERATGRLRDDVALLAVRISSGPGERSGAPASSAEESRLAF
ncbi:MAG TPA: SpoIIE family protein phosphatase [Solirubrobacteraceae bacterium]|jgi:PAS domain S-box-containing protein